MQALPRWQLVEDGLPILSQRGFLVMSGVGSPAAGKVEGTPMPSSGPAPVSCSSASAASPETSTWGTEQCLAFSVGAKDAPFPEIGGIFSVDDDVAYTSLPPSASPGCSPLVGW